MQGSTRGFTLIELLLVISIIVLLMALLAPAMNAVIMAVKIKDTEHRIAAIRRAVADYRRVYNALPPDSSPDQAMDRASPRSYPQYQYPDGTPDEETSTDGGRVYIFNHGNWNKRVYGGKFLAYFLMGPYGTGWHRPGNPADTRDPFYRCKSITAEWDVPLGLTEYLSNKRVRQGAGFSVVVPGAANPAAYPFPVFVDAFGLEGSNGGTIGYLKADTRKTGPGKWTTHDGALSPAYTADCRTFGGSWGDDRSQDHIKRMVAQCRGDFVLISPGPDRKFGWRVTTMTYQRETRKGSFAHYDRGICDDIASFPLK